MIRLVSLATFKVKWRLAQGMPKAQIVLQRTIDMKESSSLHYISHLIIFALAHHKNALLRTKLGGTETSCYSVINPAVTSFELEHYFAIAEPTAIAVDAAQVQTVEKALKNLTNRSSPQIVMIDDGCVTDNASHLSLVGSSQLHAEPY